MASTKQPINFILQWQRGWHALPYANLVFAISVIFVVVLCGVLRQFGRALFELRRWVSIYFPYYTRRCPVVSTVL